MAHLNGSHHVTLSVGPAQEDVDFHVETLGMRFIKRTVLFDGSLPIYHLYYSNANGDASSVVPTRRFGTELPCRVVRSANGNRAAFS